MFGSTTWAGGLLLILVGAAIVIRTANGSLIPALRRLY